MSENRNERELPDSPDLVLLVMRDQEVVIDDSGFSRLLNWAFEDLGPDRNKIMETRSVPQSFESPSPDNASNQPAGITTVSQTPECDNQSTDDSSEIYKGLKHCVRKIDGVDPTGADGTNGDDAASIVPSTLESVADVVKKPGDGKREAWKILDVELIRKKRRHLYVPYNRNNRLCFATSLVYVLRSGLTDQQAEALALDWQSKVGLTAQSPVAFHDVIKFERFLNRKIVVFYRNAGDKAFSHFQTDFSGGVKTVFLLLLGNHYYGVKNPPGFLGTKRFCLACFKGFDKEQQHVCAGRCPICVDPVCRKSPTDRTRYCAECRRTCRSETCFARHKKPKSVAVGVYLSRCQKVKSCLKCGSCCAVNVGKPHNCLTKCLICDEEFTETHLCFKKTGGPDKELQKNL